MRISYSQLSAFARCPQQKLLEDKLRHGELEQAPESISRSAYGSVMHAALHVMERRKAQGEDDPLGHALSTFDYYWDPQHIDAICPPVTIWVGRDTWLGMQRKGAATLKLYWEHLQRDKSRVLGLEVPFDLPYFLDGEEHNLVGVIDRLAVKKTSGRTVLMTDDFKSGQQKYGLRHNVQFTIYAWATTQPAFWNQWPDGEELFDTFRLLPRRGTWVSVQSGVTRSDTGFRGPQDYQRMDLMIRGFVQSVKADIYPLNLSGETCGICNFQEICGGVPVPDEKHGSEGAA